MQDQWLVSRLTTGWSFGVHPSWARMREGMKVAASQQAGRVRYVTLLREPVRTRLPVRRIRMPCIRTFRWPTDRVDNY